MTKSSDQLPNPYFEIGIASPINAIETLLSLNAVRSSYLPCDSTPVTNVLHSSYVPHSTAGIFRGQIRNLPLIPRCFRGIDNEIDDLLDVARWMRWSRATRDLRHFCERAEIHNPGFPPGIADRMSIAQHFGVRTPLLDWSRNIFTAIFFAIREVYSDPSFEESMQVFVFHVKDERLLCKGLPEEAKLGDYAKSAFVEPFRIDRRIERQQGVFTFHPHPALRPPKIPADVYVLEWEIIERLIPLMKGFGYTEDYFFPDYAGIAQAVISDSSLD